MNVWWPTGIHVPTYKKILEGRPYFDCTVEKIECKNHIFRNMCKKLKCISTDTKYPASVRKKITTQRILAIRKVICSSIAEHTAKDVNFDTKVNSLFSDITNSHNHAFGNHEHCQPYYCNSQKNSEDLTLTLKTCSIWHRIKFIINTVASKARSLTHNSDSNRAESFNSIIAKFVGGKRKIFRCVVDMSLDVMLQWLHLILNVLYQLCTDPFWDEAQGPP